MVEVRYCKTCKMEIKHDIHSYDELTGCRIEGIGDWIYSGFGLDKVKMYVCQKCDHKTKK